MRESKVTKRMKGNQTSCFPRLTYQQQSGAVGACWAHNPEVRGSKPRSAKIFPFLKIILILNCQKLSKLSGEELFASDLTFFLLERF